MKSRPDSSSSLGTVRQRALFAKERVCVRATGMLGRCPAVQHLTAHPKLRADPAPGATCRVRPNQWVAARWRQVLQESAYTQIIQSAAQSEATLVPHPLRPGVVETLAKTARADAAGSFSSAGPAHESKALLLRNQRLWQHGPTSPGRPAWRNWNGNTISPISGHRRPYGFGTRWH